MSTINAVIITFEITLPGRSMPGGHIADQIALQDEIREYFSWDVSDDIRSAHQMSQTLIGGYELDLSKYDHIGIVGAAAEVKDVQNSTAELLIVADGSLGAISEISRVGLLVSDADGAPHIQRAVENRIPIALHAHGDNLHDWKEFATTFSDSYPLILTHQTPIEIEGMINVGGFTDGDRAICLALAFGAQYKSIQLIGFKSNDVGRWSGVTNEALKLEKLRWMEKIIQELGYGEQIG
tara:strand:+ start:982 stop:1695 length:714 start_codon:yes stop_codon:yes gene_type:complete